VSRIVIALATRSLILIRRSTKNVTSARTATFNPEITSTWYVPVR
jgi:hypothetical protein